MRARYPDLEAAIDIDGVAIAYEVYDRANAPTVLLLPTWTLVSSRVWKGQIPFLARHFRVITFDGPGNGRSGRPSDPAHYAQDAIVRQALAVLEETEARQAVVVSLSRASMWALELVAEHPDRVLGAAFIGPRVDLAPNHEGRTEAMSRFAEPYTSTEGWAKFNAHYWRDHYDDFLEWWFGEMIFPEPRSTKQIEDGIEWAHGTTVDILLAEARMPRPSAEQQRSWAARVTRPVLVLHGTNDQVNHPRMGQALAAAAGGAYVELEGSGHAPNARDPVPVNRLLKQFVETASGRLPAARRWTRGPVRPRRALFVSSPIGLGHALRDIAIATELRYLRPDLEIDWLAQHPVTVALETEGERIHPASASLTSESAHLAAEASGHDLHCFQAFRRMDEILLANFHVFQEAVEEGDYDLVLGDEAWEIDHYWHESPELKRCSYVWLTDFVGWLPVPEGGEDEVRLTADYNAEMLEHLDRHPRIRDRSIFIGDPEDVVPHAFGPGLPAIRPWVEAHFDFSGYVTPVDPDAGADREELRSALGYEPDEHVCLVTVGGSGVGEALLRRIVEAYPEARREIPGLRMVAVAGPRIDPSVLPAHDGLDVRAYVNRLHRHLAGCDLALVQGGLTTTMELTAGKRPFAFFPLRRHFEQTIHVPHRLRRYGAGRRLEYDAATPEAIAQTIAAMVGGEAAYSDVAADGAARAARLIAEVL